ncbi:MAG: hypothetical protein HDR08_12485 [Lachnospiraceae bacterium]|nr:hypothetical protein [Lachnospiraceae bacterium]
MSNQVLEMRYHPAKKEVEFRRFQGNAIIEIDKGSKLRKYMNQKGTFVLQDKGNEFLEDIAFCFDGERSVIINVITTKNDYEDFEQMVEYYNSQTTNAKMDITLLAELPDMVEAFDVVKKHGEESVSILKKHKAKFFEVLEATSPATVKECVDSFAKDAQSEIDNIEDKIKAMGENNVNLCFAGVYSAGKSALINSILGHEILPEAISSETARMFRIQSPAEEENVRIVFSIRADYSEIMWSDKEDTFIFTAGPIENATREEIQKEMNRVRGNARHIQLNNILKKLNSLEGVSSEIKVFFKIPLDNDRVQFTIYDTPGTDSNYIEHQSVLMDALSSQTHSILIFVVAPTKLEGEGNNVLLNYLNKLEHDTNKASIDLGRSLFVMNWADSILTPEARAELPFKTITSKEDSDISIKLSDKKLFFTAAKYAYVAAAVKNGIADENQNMILEDDYSKIRRPERGRYYMLNHCALSEIATKKQLDASEAALEQALENDDRAEVFHICSGVYALENEISLYGKKYAAAVRAFAIIDSVDKALNNMNDRAASLKSNNQADIDRVNNEIDTIRTTLNQAIDKVSREKELLPNRSLPENILLDLHLDRKYLTTEVVGKAQISIGKFLRKWFLGLFGKVNIKKEHKEKTESVLKAILKDYVNDFVEKREKLLENQRDDFQRCVTEIIKSNGGISDEAKRFIAQIHSPEISTPDIVSIIDLYDEKVSTSKILKKEQIDKDEFLTSVWKEMTDIVNPLAEDLERDFRDEYARLLSQVKSEFEQNLEKYSTMVKAKLDDKKAIENLGGKIQAAADELKQCQNKLEEIIWRVKDENR